MGNIYEFSKLRNQYKTVFDRALEGCGFYYGYEDEIAFIDLYDRVFNIYIDGNKVKIVKEFDNYSSIENIELPSKRNNHIVSVETIIDKVEEGNRTEVIQRFYGQNKKTDEDYFVINLFDNMKIVSDDYKNSITNEFECHMLGDEVIAETRYIETAYSSDGVIEKTYDKDLSNLYSGIKGLRKVEKIFDLYRGKKSQLVRLELKDITEGILDEKCFNYRENETIKENEINTVEKNKVYEKI